MADPRPFHIRQVKWIDEGPRLSALRGQVFMVEQGVPADEEWDGRDPQCIHVMAESPDGEVIGTGRLQADGRIGRMAVTADWRGRGVGQTILASLVALARQLGHDQVDLNAQTAAIGFYERNGFRAEGPEFMEAGIPHRYMVRKLEGFND